MATIPALAQPEITIVDGHAVTTSIALAEYFHKLHKDVLRKIECLECSPEFTGRNFTLSDYIDPTGRKLPCYQITRDGFAFLAMGFTGKKAAIFKENYISAFNVMEAQLRDSTSNSIAAMHSSTYRIQQTFTTDGVLVCSRRMGEGELCADFETFIELARRGGYLVIREDDLLTQLRGGAKGITKK
ncbi:Rha family transcriptional regulator [Serratia sp. Ag1]|uniref:Rha family transcriptional regulator n=1 Tax=unclassified Serratia (in: enterobacteria) TaxID=2647522 RepID=UPI00268D96D6